MKVCWHGSSLTFGAGFPIDDRDRFIYDRLVSKKLEFQHQNFAELGNSNLNIFKSACRSMLEKRFDHVFVQWTVLNRIWLYPGPDTQLLVTSAVVEPYRYREIFLSRRKLMALRDQLLLLNHDYHNLLELIDFCNILQKLSQSCQCNLTFINGNIPWTNDLENTINTENPGHSMSTYTKSLLDFDYRDDSEIICLFERLQNSFSSLDTSIWVNLYDSFENIAVDVGPEGHHPGIKSHALMAELIINHLSFRGISN